MKKEFQLAVLLGAVCANLARAATLYVSPAGTNDAVNRYNTWEGAAQSINDAVAIAAANDEVVVTNGAYSVTNQMVVNAFSLRSVNGPESTVVYRHSSYETRILAVSHSNAWVSGFTFTNAQANIYGCGQCLELSAGIVSNCIITKCPGWTSLQAGLVNISGGVMTHSVLSNNTSRSYCFGITGGVLQDSVVYGNYSPYDPSPLRVYGSGAARRCRILENYTGGSSLPVVDVSGTLENCLIWGNRIGPAVSMGSGARLLNCTVASNAASAGAGAGGIYRTGGSVTNSIVYGNFVAGIANNYGGSVSAVSYSCAPELTLGLQGNVNTDPKFVSMAAGDCHLAFGSPCVNSGTNLAAVTVDLEGTARDMRCDMGAYERVTTGGPLRAGFTGFPLSGIGLVTSVFTATLEGTNQNVNWWGWDFDNDGSYDASGSALQVVTNIFYPGRYTVVVRAQNTSGEVAEYTNVNYVAVQSADNNVYASTNGSNTFPFDTWAKSTTNLYDAVMKAAHGGSTVWVSNGAYKISLGLSLGTNITVRGVNGPLVTLIYRDTAAGTGFPIFYLSQSGAQVAGVTLSNGCWGVSSGAGGAVTMTAGLVTNCVMVGTVADSYNNGVLGLWGGTVSGCVISNNTPRSFTVYVTAGVMEDTIVTRTTAGHDAAPVVIGYGPSAGTVRRCQIVNNTPPGAIAGGVQISGAGRMENCLVYGNKAQSGAYGGVRLEGGTMLNCTVASNSTVSGAAGVTLTSGTMTNCIVFGNAAGFPNYSGIASNAAYSCAPELTNSAQGNITNNPLFVNLAAGDCHLQKLSPCINKGYTDDAMRSGVDLDGLPRVKQSVVDMGAYELPPPLGTLLELR